MLTPFRYFTVALIFLAVFSGGFVFAQDEEERERDPNAIYDPGLYGAMKYRMIGPYRGGRVTAVTGVRGQPFTFYFGATGGGVWKTTNAGEKWTVVSDTEKLLGKFSDEDILVPQTNTPDLRPSVRLVQQAAIR